MAHALPFMPWAFGCASILVLFGCLVERAELEASSSKIERRWKQVTKRVRLLSLLRSRILGYALFTPAFAFRSTLVILVITPHHFRCCRRRHGYQHTHLVRISWLPSKPDKSATGLQHATKPLKLATALTNKSMATFKLVSHCGGVDTIPSMDRLIHMVHSLHR